MGVLFQHVWRSSSHGSSSPQHPQVPQRLGASAGFFETAKASRRQNWVPATDAPPSSVPVPVRKSTYNVGYNYWLVVDLPIWKNMSESQLGWWNSQLNGQIIFMFQTTNQDTTWRYHDSPPTVYCILYVNEYVYRYINLLSLPKYRTFFPTNHRGRGPPAPAVRTLCRFLSFVAAPHSGEAVMPQFGRSWDPQKQQIECWLSGD
jgi:hypothetical protein